MILAYCGINQYLLEAKRKSRCSDKDFSRSVKMCSSGFQTEQWSLIGAMAPIWLVPEEIEFRSYAFSFQGHLIGREVFCGAFNLNRAYRRPTTSISSI